MKNTHLNPKSIEELWVLHEEITSILFAKMEAEKLKFQKRLDQLGMTVVQDLRRPYPEVRPKFRNPNRLIRRGPVAANNRTGYVNCCRKANSWMMFGLSR
jgi:hypothetical protein